MMHPLHNRVVVKLDPSIVTNIPGFIAPIKTDAWRGKDQAIESYNRGIVIAVGPGKKDPKTLRPMQMYFDAEDGRRALRAGDVVRFSEIEYPTFKEHGETFALITDGDVVGVEVSEAAGA
jgi:co-chaperonin GroES (HSP10)